jgi:NAD(P)-dependent dehydrogenase (short-subunit alcohol dehydrogenase family)
VSGPLTDRIAVVTGGASGIGRATAVALAAAGASVVIVDRDSEGAERVAAEIGQVGVAAKAYVADLGNATAIDPLVNAILADFGRIDILVNSAGVTGGGRHNALDFSDELYETVMSINLRAPFLLTRAVGNHMAERGGGGRIVNLSSSAAFRATSSPAVYAASKSGINGLTRASAADLAPYDVNVNAVAPGMTKTPMTAHPGDDEAYERMVSSGPMENLFHRVSEAEDVANAIVFLCLPESRQITGQVLHTSAGVVV